MSTLADEDGVDDASKDQQGDKKEDEELVILGNPLREEDGINNVRNRIVILSDWDEPG